MMNNPKTYSPPEQLGLRKKNLVSPIMAIVVGLSFSEFTLQILSLISVRINTLLSRTIIQPIIYDERLGWRPNPEHPEHDSKGFRNKFVPNEISIVCMGDS